MPLLWQIWGLHFAASLFLVTAVCLAIDHYGADYLMKIMKQCHFLPVPLHGIFTEKLHFLARSAGVVGGLAGAALGFFISQGIVSPLKEIVVMTGRRLGGRSNGARGRRRPD